MDSNSRSLPSALGCISYHIHALEHVNKLYVYVTWTNALPEKPDISLDLAHKRVCANFMDSELVFMFESEMTLIEGESEVLCDEKFFEISAHCRDLGAVLQESENLHFSDSKLSEFSNTEIELVCLLCNQPILAVSGLQPAPSAHWRDMSGAWDCGCCASAESGKSLKKIAEERVTGTRSNGIVTTKFVDLRSVAESDECENAAIRSEMPDLFECITCGAVLGPEARLLNRDKIAGRCKETGNRVPYLTRKLVTRLIADAIAEGVTWQLVTCADNKTRAIIHIMNTTSAYSTGSCEGAAIAGPLQVKWKTGTRIRFVTNIGTDGIAFAINFTRLEEIDGKSATETLNGKEMCDLLDDLKAASLELPSHLIPRSQGGQADALSSLPWRMAYVSSSN